MGVLTWHCHYLMQPRSMFPAGQMNMVESRMAPAAWTPECMYQRRLK